jgi:hypothetical protein
VLPSFWPVFASGGSAATSPEALGGAETTSADQQHEQGRVDEEIDPAQEPPSYYERYSSGSAWRHTPSGF